MLKLPSTSTVAILPLLIGANHRAQFETENADHLAEAKASLLASETGDAKFEA